MLQLAQRRRKYHSCQLFEWRDRSRMESRIAETHLWQKSMYDLNMRVAK